MQLLTKEEREARFGLIKLRYQRSVNDRTQPYAATYYEEDSLPIMETVSLLKTSTFTAEADTEMFAWPEERGPYGPRS